MADVIATLTVEFPKYILWQVLCLYMVADVIPYVVADVITHIKQGARCLCHFVLFLVGHVRQFQWWMLLPFVADGRWYGHLMNAD